MSSPCTKCDYYIQSIQLIKQNSIHQAQEICDLNNKNKKEQELTKKLSSEINVLTESNNELNKLLKVELDKEEKSKQLENKCNELESELENIRKNKNERAQDSVNMQDNVANHEKIKNEYFKDLELKLQKYKTDNEELIKNIGIKDNYIKTLNKEGQDNKSIVMENKTLVLLNEELKSTLDNIRKDCKNCQELKEQKQELKGTNMKYRLEKKALERKVNDLDRELKEVKSFNGRIQNENIKLSTQIDKFKELQPEKVEELSRTVDRLKRLISSDTKQRKMEINKTCEICKVTANLIFDCFKGNETYRAVNSAGGKLQDAYKHAKFSLLKHVQNNLITHMLTIDGESDLLKSIEEIIEKDKLQKKSDKKIKPKVTNGDSSPSYMATDSEDNTVNNDLSVENTDRENESNIQVTKTRATNRNKNKSKRINKTSNSSRNNSAIKSMKKADSNTQETIEIIGLEEIFPEDSLKYRSKVNIKNVGVPSADDNELASISSCPTDEHYSKNNKEVKIDFDYQECSFELDVENNNNNNKEGNAQEIEITKSRELVCNIDDGFPESCRGVEYISTPFCVVNDVEITRETYKKKCNAPCYSEKSIKTENSKEIHNWNSPTIDFPADIVCHAEQIKADIIDCELNLSINENPLNLSLKSNPFPPNTEVIEFDNLIDCPLNLSTKKLNPFIQSNDSEIKFVHSTPILKFQDHYKENPQSHKCKEINQEQFIDYSIKSVKKRKIINEENPEICSKKLKLNDVNKNRFIIEKHPKININILQRIVNELPDEHVRRYQDMTDCILPPLLSLPVSIDSINQSQTNKIPLTNHLLTNEFHEMNSETPKQLDKLHSESSSQSTIIQLEDSQISLVNLTKGEKQPEENPIENIFRELMQKNPKDFHSIIKQKIVIETESQAKVFVDNFLNFFLHDNYKSFDRKLTADIAYYLILSLYRQCNPIYDYYYNGLLSALKSKGFNPILFMTNLEFLILVQKWDLLMEFLIDLIRLPNVRFLTVAKWIKPTDVFLPCLTAKYSSVIDLIKRIVSYEYSIVNRDSEHRKSFDSNLLKIQKFWLNGQTTQNLQPIDDDFITSVLELTNQIVVEFKSQKLFHNLYNDNKLKYVINK